MIPALFPPPTKKSSSTQTVSPKLEIPSPQNISHLLQSEAEFWHSESQCPNAHCSPHKVINLTKKTRKQMDSQFISGHFLINSNFSGPLPFKTLICPTAVLQPILLFRLTGKQELALRSQKDCKDETTPCLNGADN